MFWMMYSQSVAHTHTHTHTHTLALSHTHTHTHAHTHTRSHTHAHFPLNHFMKTRVHKFEKVNSLFALIVYVDSIITTQSLDCISQFWMISLLFLYNRSHQYIAHQNMVTQIWHDFFSNMNPIFIWNVDQMYVRTHLLFVLMIFVLQEQTPLQVASLNGHIDIVKMMIDANGDVNVRNKYQVFLLCYSRFMRWHRLCDHFINWCVS